MHFRLNGVHHHRESLADWCHRTLEQPQEPEWNRALGRFLQQWLDPSLESVGHFTSGTTGPPTRMLLRKESMIRSARMTLSHFGLGAGDRALLCLPVRYIAGKMMAVRALVGGLDLVTVEPSGRPLESLERPVEFAAMVPLQVHNTLRHGDELSRCGLVLIGGGEIHPALRKELETMESPQLFESFAMSETYSHIALRRINGIRRDSSFRILEGVSVRQDQRGCLVVEAEGITSGPVVTSDLVELTPDRKGFAWLGRADHLVSTGGIKVIPEVLEQKISALLGVVCLVLPEPDEQLGQRLVLLVEHTGAGPAGERWMGLLRENLEAHQVPKRIVTVPELPRNASFKPDRHSAREFL